MASYVDQISSLDPKIWFKFNETAGTPSNSGSLSCSLTTTGTPLLNSPSSVDGTSVYLNGSSYYTLSNFPAFSVFDDRSFSIEGWFKVPTVGANAQYLVKISDPAFNTSYAYVCIRNGVYAGNLEFGFKAGTGYNVTGALATGRYDDNKWHHFVATVNTTSVKLYIDGGLRGSSTTTTPASIDFDGSNTIKTIGEGVVGSIDEIAIYPFELTPVQVNANYVAGTAVYVTPDVLTASATFPMTTSITVINYAAAPMTASAAAGNALQNDVDLPQSLNTYMSTLSLEQWYKFDEYRKITNYGTGGTSAWSFYGTTDSEFNGGVQGSGAIKFTGNASTGLISGYGSSPAVINPELTDGDFSIGFWFKKNNIDDNANLFQATNFTNYIDITFDAQGHIDANYHSNANHVLNTGVDVTDGQWHFLVFRLSGSSLSLYLDGSSVATGTVNNTFSTALTDYAFGQGNGGSDNIYLSQFFIATAANVQSTQISNMWTYGSVQSQGGACMVMPVISFNNAFNTFVQSKTPWFDVRMDEASGAPANYTSHALSLSATGSNYSQGVSSRNRYAYDFTNRDTKFEGSWSSPTGTFTGNQRQTLAVYAKMSTISAAAGIASTGSTGGNFGVGLTLIALANTGYIRLRVNSTTSLYDQIDTTTSYADNNYHLFVAVKDGSSLKLYIDGKEVGSTTSSYNLTDSGTFTIAGQPNATPSGARSLTVDEVSVFHRAFTAEEAFNMWQAISLEMDTTATSTFVMPAIGAGTGQTISAAPATASANMEKIANFANHMEAFALFQMPNYEATVNLNANYGSEPFAASALFHMPQYSIGEFNSVDHMNASALMRDPVIVTPGRFVANPLIALDAKLVMPGVVTIKGARVFADYMSAKSFAVIPPAYFTLIDDSYYRTLFGQHSTILEEPAGYGTNLASESKTAVVKSYLKFFNDVKLPITIGSTRYLTSELPANVFQAPGTILTDGYGNIIIDSTKLQLQANGQRTATPTPLLAPGYFDEQERPAVRLNNIEFAYPADVYVTDRPYSLEFTIKTTKSNQIIAKGRKDSYYYYAYSIGTIGLFNGKLYSMTSRNDSNIHPTIRGTNNYLLGNQRIDDGKWHHVIVQYGFDGRWQYWIDGKLDRQIYTEFKTIGDGFGSSIRPYIMGSSSNTDDLQADFETSVWSYDPGQFTSRDYVGINYNSYLRYEPIKAETMTATLTSGAHKGKGNRARALMLYFWSTRSPDANYSTYADFQGGLDISRSRYTGFDIGANGEFDYDTFYPLTTWEGRSNIYDWDVFPIDVQGYYASRVVKQESYKDYRELQFVDPYTGNLGTIEYIGDGFKDELDNRRYLDILKDIVDVESFDAIFFRNYPDQSVERDQYFRNETVDNYFGIRENELFEAFLKNLRAAVDSGINLYITNPQLAVDMGIIDRIEIADELNDLKNLSAEFSDPWSEERVSTNGSSGYDSGYFLDTYKNNRHRVVNTLTNLTDWPGYYLTEQVNFQNRDEIDFGGVDRYWNHLEHRPNGLTIGDEFIFNPMEKIQGVPLENIKAGKAITTFGATYRNGVVETPNPYRNYATTIAVSPGDVLNGTQLGGKIFVNFADIIQREIEDVVVEIKSDFWINKGVADGTIDPESAEDYRNSLTFNIDRKLAAGKITQEQYNHESYWSLNGDNITGGAVSYGAIGQRLRIYSTSSGAVRTSRKSVTSGSRRRAKDTGTASDQFMFYKAEWGYVNPVMWVQPLTINMLGLTWLSDRVVYETPPQRPLAIEANATMTDVTVIADKDRVVYAEAMIANASTPEIGTVPNRTQLSLPMYAQARITDVTKAYYPEPYTTTAFMPQNVKVTSFDTDQVVLYVMHEDAILYIREDVIK